MAYLCSLFVLTLAVTLSWCQTTTPTPPTTTAASSTRRPKPTHVYDDVITTLTKQGQFSSLLALLNSTNLDTALLSAPELTLFAPTDDAFSRLPQADLTALQGSPSTQTSLLQYHAVGEAVRLNHPNDKVLTTLVGTPLRINVYGIVHATTAEGIRISQKDIHIQNGFLNVVDDILEPPSGSVMDIISSRADLSTLNSLLTSSGLDAVIKADENITVFAPTNAAFSNVDPKVLDYLQQNPKALSEVLLFHVVNRLTLYSIGMRHALTFPSADTHHDRIMSLEDSTGEIYVNNARITERDVSATNGVIHAIDNVLIPTKVFITIADSGLTIG